MRDAYIVSSVRTPVAAEAKGPSKIPGRKTCCLHHEGGRGENRQRSNPQRHRRCHDRLLFPEAEQGLNIGRLATQIAGFPITVSGATVNRFCSSGLEAIALASLRVMAGWSEVTMGGGVESMTYVPMGGNLPRPHPEHSRAHADLYASMGITAENVANRYRCEP
jgi:acetyl-CoA acyltransferase